MRVPKVDVPTKSWLIDRTTYIGKPPLWFKRVRRKIDRKRDVFLWKATELNTTGK